MNNPLGDFKDEVLDQFETIPKIAKKQILGEVKKDEKQDKQKDKNDPITNKPKPSKKMLTQLTQATAQLQQAKLQKLREELDKQRLKVTDDKQKLAPIELVKTAGHGPAIESSEREKAPQPDAVAATMRSSKSTGEFGRQVGG